MLLHVLTSEAILQKVFHELMLTLMPINNDLNVVFTSVYGDDQFRNDGENVVPGKTICNEKKVMYTRTEARNILKDSVGVISVWDPVSNN